MATVDELQNRFDAIDAVIPNTDGTFTVDGKKLSVDEYKKVKADAKKALDDAKKQQSEIVQQAVDIEDLQKQIQIDTLVLAGERLPQSLAAYQSSGRMRQVTTEDRRKRLAENQARLQQLTAVQPGGRSPAASAAGDLGRERAETRRGRVRPVAGAKEEPVTPGGQPTTPGGQQVTPGGGKTVRGPKLSEEQIIAKFREMFPTQAWLTEADPTKYPGLRKVIRNAVEGKMWSSAQGQARFDAQFRASDFYRELASTDKIRQIKTLVGDLGFDSKPFNTFVKDAMNFGWEGDTLKQEVYKEVFRKDDTTGAFVNPTAVERTRKSAPYLQLQNVGKAYFNTVSDTTIQNVLTGGMSSEDVARQQREFAKTKYAHLSNLIDQGLTLEDISQPFRKQAAQMLERSEDDIDMSTADFEVAFNVGEEGKKRIMTTGEWNRALRTNKVFGWDKTDGAKREAREIAASIVQAFGRVI